MNNVLFWSWLAIFCAMALFLQGVLVLRVAIHMRHRWWLLACAPLAVSLWSWQQVCIASSMAPHPATIWGHLNAASYEKLLWSFSHAMQVAQSQVVILLVTFVLTSVMAARCLPRVNTPPVWTMRQMERVNR